MGSPDGPRRGTPGDLGKRGGYQGDRDPGQPANLTQPQTTPIAGATGQGAGESGSTGAAEQSGSAGGGSQESGSG